MQWALCNATQFTLSKKHTLQKGEVGIISNITMSMELFSEIYNCYYQIMKSILEEKSALSLDELRGQIMENGYEESLLYLIPKLTSGEWNLFERDGDTFISRLSGNFYVPLTNLQKSYIKTILQDKRIQLFFAKEDIQRLQDLFENVDVLWQPTDFYYYDRFSNRDNYGDSTYQENFRTLVNAIRNHQYVDICYESRLGHRVHHHYLPCRLEYSIKNDKFRLLGMVKKSKKRTRNLWNRNSEEKFAELQADVEILNLDRMKRVSLLPEYVKELPDINERIRSTYYKEPVHLLIHTDRNALERTMLQFANYEKNTSKIDDNTYECLIYYNQKMETELLIEVLSFGPMVKVLGSERFLQLLKERLRRQKRLL